MSEKWRNENWFTSSWNFAEEVRSSLHFSDHIKIHDVARIIAVQVQHAGPCLDLLGYLEDLFRRRRLKHAAHAAAIQHPLSHIAKEQRQVACAAAGHNRHLTGRFVSGTIAAQVARRVFDRITMRRVDAAQHIIRIILRPVDNLLHNVFPPFILQRLLRSSLASF